MAQRPQWRRSVWRHSLRHVGDDAGRAYDTDPKQFARIYEPADARAGGTPMPVIVYYHGGGWVIADVATYDAAPRAMAKALDAIVVSVYPIANSSMTLPRARTRPTLSRSTGRCCRGLVIITRRARRLRRTRELKLVAANLRGLPPTTIINAHNDPLRSNGETLAAAMRAAGDKLEQKTFRGVTNEFFGLAGIVNGAQQANDLAVARLKAALGR